jgi:hypothetical protein
MQQKRNHHAWIERRLLDRLDRQLESAHAVTVALFREVMEIASERLSILRRAGKTAHIERSLVAGACTEAALALLELEMPNWTIRRLVNEGGEWLCSLSRRPWVPTEFDDMVEARHAVLSLAVLRALGDPTESHPPNQKQ